MIRTLVTIVAIVIAGLIYVAAVPADVFTLVGLVVWMGIIGAMVEYALGGNRERSR